MCLEDVLQVQLQPCQFKTPVKSVVNHQIVADAAFELGTCKDCECLLHHSTVKPSALKFLQSSQTKWGWQLASQMLDFETELFSLWFWERTILTLVQRSKSCVTTMLSESVRPVENCYCSCMSPDLHLQRWSIFWQDCVKGTVVVQEKETARVWHLMLQ